MSSYEDLIKSMNAKAVEFDGHLAKVKTANDALVARSNEVMQALTDLLGTVRPTKKCSVCYTRERSHANLNCGHVFCSECAERGLSRNRCYTCRAKIEGLFRVFI